MKKDIIEKLADAHRQTEKIFEAIDSLCVYSKIFEKTDNFSKKIICDRLRKKYYGEKTKNTSRISYFG